MKPIWRAELDPQVASGSTPTAVESRWWSALKDFCPIPFWGPSEPLPGGTPFGEGELISDRPDLRWELLNPVEWVELVTPLETHLVFACLRTDEGPIWKPLDGDDRTRDWCPRSPFQIWTASGPFVDSFGFGWTSCSGCETWNKLQPKWLELKWLKLVVDDEWWWYRA